jgi:cellulose 1,4-beta-cellobiosidase
MGTGAVSTNGAPLRLESLSGADEQLWTLSPAGSNSILMLNRSSGLAAGVQTTNTGETAAQRLTNGSLNQQWVLLAPPALAAKPGAGYNSLSWRASPDALGYNLKRSLLSGGPYTTVAIGITSTSYTDSAVTNGTTYYYVVSTTTALGESPNSAEASAMPSFSQGLVTWFKANSLSGVTNGELWLREMTNGALVYYWPDASGSGYDAGPLGTAPIYVTNAINGQPALRFTASQGTCLTFNRPVQDDFTILCVFRSSQGVGTGTAFYSGAGLVNGEVAGVTDDFGTSLNANGQVLGGTGNPDVTCVSSGAACNNGQAHISSFKRTRSTGALRLYVDGALSASTTGGTQSLTAPYLLTIGSQQTLNNYLDGDIAEIKIFNAPLSDTERVAEEDALKCKYGLGSGAAPATPPGLTATAGNRKIALSWAGSAGASGYQVSWSTNISGPFVARSSSVVTTAFVDTNAAYGITNYYVVAAMGDCGVSGNSAVVGALLPRPELAVRVDSASLVVSWPAWAADWMLYSATNLSRPVSWSLVGNIAQDVGTNMILILPLPSESSAFIRLQAP